MFSATMEILVYHCTLGCIVVGTRGNDRSIDAIGGLVVARKGSLVLALEFLSLSIYYCKHYKNTMCGYHYYYSQCRCNLLDIALLLDHAALMHRKLQSCGSRNTQLI